MKPKYEEFTPEEIEDLDNSNAELAEENSVLQGRVDELVEALTGLYELRSHLLNAAVRDNGGVLHSTAHIAARLERARAVIAKNLE